MRKKLRVEEGISLIPTSQNSTTKGDLSTRTADENLHVYLDGADRSVVTENQAQPITNKTIDVDNNTVTNIETDNLKSGVLNTSTSLASASDTQVPSALAVKTYTDAGDATNAGAISTVATNLSNHINATTDAHDASAISTTPISGVTGTDVQANLASLKSLIDAGGNGDVMGPASSTDNAVARFDSTTGKIIQNSSVTISDVGVVAGMTIDTATNSITNLDNANFKVNAMIDAVKIADGSVTNAEFQRLDGVTSPIQTQIDSKVNTTGGSVITPARLDMKQDTLANLTTYALTANNGQLVFATDTKETFVVKDGQLSAVGGGSGGINYNLNPNADTNTNGYVTYANAAGTAPITGTGGSPTVTFTRTTSSPLRGVASFLYTKPASNVQGQGYSYDFVIADEDKGKVLSASFAYQIASGTYADNDMSIWIYDITNARMIQGAPYLIKNSGIIEYFATEFQTAINSNSYRIIFHTASTSALAYTVKFDSFNISKQGKLYGSAVTDWVSYTPVWTASSVNPTIGNGVIAGKWRRVGDSMEIRTYLIFGSTSTKGTGTYAISIPSGFNVDTSKLPASSTLNSIGTGQYLAQSSVSYAQVQTAALLNGSTTSYSMVTDQNSVSNTFSSAQTGVFTTANDNWETSVKVPILGWSSSQVMSSDASTRVVATSSNYKLATGTLNGSYNLIKIPAGTVDTHGTYNASTGEYTIPVPGLYDINLYVETTFGATSDSAGVSVSIYKNGSPVGLYGNNYIARNIVGNITATKNGILNLVAGDKISFFAQSGAVTPTFSNAATGSGFNIKMLSGPSQIMASETVAAIYSSSSGISFSSGSVAIVNYATKIVDTHNAVTTGASWKFTAPISGLYLIHAQVSFNPNATNSRELLVFVNTSTIAIDSAAATASIVTIGRPTLVQLLAGDTVDARAFQNSGGDLSINTNGSSNKINIIRVGNY